MPPQPVPITILGGSDLRPAELPAGAGHALAAYKGAELRTAGKPLVAHLVERLADAGGYGPVSVAGPAGAYAPLGLDARIIDTDGSIATNVRAAIEHHLARGAPGPAGPMGLLACDVLPEVEELRSLRTAYEADASCAFWFPFVRIPPDESGLGAFGWKPTYHLRQGPGGERVHILPGHLAIFDPRALRLALVYRLLDAGYRTRNRPLALRRRAMLRSVVAGLILQDLQAPFRQRLPTLTVAVLSSGLRIARHLRRGELGVSELESLVGRMLLRRHGPARAGDRAIRFPIVDVLSLAEDVDTEEEARAIGSEPLDLEGRAP